MPLTKGQKEGMIKRGMDLARLVADWNRTYNSFKEEYDAEAYGSVLVDEDLTAYGQSSGLTAAEWVDAVAAMDAISSAIETNKTNLYKAATGNV